MKDRLIEEILEFISNNDWLDCPLENCDVDLDCDNRCDIGIEKECWKRYFEKKVEVK